MITKSHFDVLVAPIVTEKATMLTEMNKYTFKVPLSVTKQMVKNAVEKIYSVKVDHVHCIRTQGKVKRFRGRIGKRSDFKKAIVTLAAGHSIDISTGI